MEPMNHLNEDDARRDMPTVHRTPADTMALFSVISGIIGIFFCLSPLIQFPIGAIAITLSLLARQQGKRNIQTAIGMATGIAAIVLSLIVFGCVVYVYQVVLENPVMGPIYNEMFQHYQDLLGTLGSVS